MKNTVIITLVISMMTVFSAFAQKGMDTFLIQVDGLGCPFCAYGLEKKFKEFKGIKDVKIDIETGNFSFAYPADQALTMEAVQKQVVKAGYTPVSANIKRADGITEQSDTAEVSAEKSSEDRLVAKEVKVAGNCAMCEARIKKAAKSITGVTAVSWDKDTKVMLVNFDSAATDMASIEKSIALAGHDTHNFKADKEVYEQLPACCHYEPLQ